MQALNIYTKLFSFNFIYTIDECFAGIVRHLESVQSLSKLKSTLEGVFEDCSRLHTYFSSFPRLVSFNVWVYCGVFQDVIDLRSTHTSDLFNEFLKVCSRREFQEILGYEHFQMFISITSIYEEDSKREIISRNSDERSR